MLELLVDQALHLGDAHHHDESPLKVEARGVNFWYNEEAHALIDVDLSIYDREVVALIGPSGCGKSTFIRCLNRTNDLIDGARLEGKILLNGEDIYDPSLDPPDVRKRFGIVAQRPNPFPQSIFANIAYGPRLQGLVSGKTETEEVVYNSLVRVGMWDEVKDRLQELGTDLSGGQQQRLCIARAIATNPEMMLMDEPCSALDPTATQLIENLIDSLREEFAIIIITHNLQQAARISQRTAFFHLGRLIEVGDTEKIFLNPTEERTHDYITGRFG